MRILVVDFEATDNEPRREVIQIGAALFSSNQGTWRLVDSASIYVKPASNPTISPYIYDLTGIPERSLVNAPNFEEAVRIILDGLNVHGPIVWASWGEFDFKIHEEECVAHSCVGLGRSHLNLKELYSKAIGKKKKRSLLKALGESGYIFIGQHHDARFDAINAGKLLNTVLPCSKPQQVLTKSVGEELQEAVASFLRLPEEEQVQIADSALQSALNSRRHYC